MTPEKEMKMCRRVMGQPSHLQPGVWSRKLSRAKTPQSIGTSATLFTLDCSFYLILNLFKFTEYLSIQKGNESISSGFLRCHSGTAHFPLYYTVSTERSFRALSCTSSWWAPELSIASSPVDCEENLPTTVWLGLNISWNKQMWKLWCLVHSRKCSFVSTQLNTVQHWFIKNIINEMTVVINLKSIFIDCINSWLSQN